MYNKKNKKKRTRQERLVRATAIILVLAILGSVLFSLYISIQNYL